jgi:muramoyltetrapeptide carboxypeptidase
VQTLEIFRYQHIEPGHQLSHKQSLAESDRAGNPNFSDREFSLALPVLNYYDWFMSRIRPVKPARLCFGDVVGIIAPASAPPDPKTIDLSAEALKKLGFKPKFSRNLRKRLGFLAGNDRERAADLMAMFADKKAKAIICVRGGYGSGRLCSTLDFELICQHPKILIGYSDITSLHCAFLKKANLVSFHGPMLNAELSTADLPDFTLESLLKTVMEAVPAGSIRAGFSGKTVSVIRGGRANGDLIGGNLSVLCTTLGTPYQPDFKNKILFLEDISEKPYRLDRMLTHLANAGLLQQVAGVAVGINHDCADPHANKLKEFRQTMTDVLEERLTPLKVPVVIGLPFGHQPWNATLPVGVRAELDGNNGDLIIVEPAVR